MPDQYIDLPSTPTGPTGRSWLATNRKLAILAGVALVLVLATIGVIWFRPGLARKTANTTVNTNSTVTDQSGRTFERFQAIVNRPATTNTNVSRPTKEDTAKAIQNLTHSQQ